MVPVCLGKKTIDITHDPRHRSLCHKVSNFVTVKMGEILRIKIEIVDPRWLLFDLYNWFPDQRQEITQVGVSLTLCLWRNGLTMGR